MKKFCAICVLLVFLFSTKSSFSEINFSEMSSQELSDTITKAQEELNSRKSSTNSANEEEFISSCEDVSYSDVERLPYQFKGKNIKISGKVIQVTESGLGYVILRVRYKPGKIWLVHYTLKEFEPRILEEDNIIVYGVCSGVETYHSVSAGDVTIPSMVGKYIENTANKSFNHHRKTSTKHIISTTANSDYFEEHNTLPTPNSIMKDIYYGSKTIDKTSYSGAAKMPRYITYIYGTADYSDAQIYFETYKKILSENFNCIKISDEEFWVRDKNTSDKIAVVEYKNNLLKVKFIYQE